MINTPYDNSKSQSMGNADKRRDILTPQEKELNYIIDKLAAINDTYQIAANDELDNRDNKKASNQMLSQVLGLYKFLRPRIANSELKTTLKYTDENGNEAIQYINKFYELMYRCDELENYALTRKINEKNIFLKSIPDIVFASIVYQLLREYIEDSKILAGARRLPGINE